MHIFILLIVPLLVQGSPVDDSRPAPGDATGGGILGSPRDNRPAPGDATGGGILGSPRDSHPAPGDGTGTGGAGAARGPIGGPDRGQNAGPGAAAAAPVDNRPAPGDATGGGILGSPRDSHPARGDGTGHGGAGAAAAAAGAQGGNPNDKFECVCRPIPGNVNNEFDCKCKSAAPNGGSEDTGKPDGGSVTTPAVPSATHFLGVLEGTPPPPGGNASQPQLKRNLSKNTNGATDEPEVGDTISAISCVNQSIGGAKPNWDWLKENGKLDQIRGKWLEYECTGVTISPFLTTAASYKRVNDKCVASGYEMAQAGKYLEKSWWPFQIGETLQPHYKVTSGFSMKCMPKCPYAIYKKMGLTPKDKC